MSHSRLGPLQSLRAIAAFLVLFQHTTVHTLLAKGLDFGPYLRVDFGRLGVVLFFVISGFVMAGCLDQGRRFLWNRVARIYPGFWLAIALTCFLMPDWYFDWRSALLLPSATANNSHAIPYWTLIYEMAFYLITYAMVLAGASKVLVTRTCLLWLAALVLVSHYREVPLFLPGQWILFSTLNVYFILGMLCALYRESLDKAPSAALGVFGLVAWAAYGVLKETMGGQAVLACACCAALLLALRLPRLRLLERLGDFSYGLYLVHVPIALFVLQVIKAHAPQTRLAVMWLVAFAAAGAGGLLFGWLEHTLHSRVIRRRGRRPAAASVALSN